MKRVVIFANGELKGQKRIHDEIRATDLVVCADGGARHALALGIKPSLVIGDLDSVEEEEGLLEKLGQSGVKLLQYPREKDQTDLELAFEFAINEKAEEIVLLCALGGRLDHWLANMLLLAQAKYTSARIQILDDEHRGFILRGDDTISLDSTPGYIFSLIPLSPRVEGVTLDGCKWPLCDATLEFGSPLSISNVVNAALISVRIKSGVALALMTGS